MSEITELLLQAKDGEPASRDCLFAAIYRELIALARARLSHSRFLFD